MALVNSEQRCVFRRWSVRVFHLFFSNEISNFHRKLKKEECASTDSRWIEQIVDPITVGPLSLSVTRKSVCVREVVSI